MPEHSRNAGRAFSIRVPINMFKEVEKKLKYRFWDKERERSNRAAGWAWGEKHSYRGRCLRNHDTIAWVGPPHDPIRAYVCLHCYGAACEPEIRDRGFDFETIPDWEIHKIMNLDLERQVQGDPNLFAPWSGK